MLINFYNNYLKAITRLNNPGQKWSALIGGLVFIKFMEKQVESVDLNVTPEETLYSCNETMLNILNIVIIVSTLTTVGILYKYRYKILLTIKSHIYPMLFIITLILYTGNTAECGTWDSTDTPRADLEALVRTFDREQLQELNHILDEENTANQGNSLLYSLFLFAAVNITIIVIARYGNTIFENVVSLVTESADTLLEAARQAAINRVNRLLENPDNLPRVRNAIATIARMRHAHMMPPMA